MRIGDLMGFVGGVAFAAIGLRFTPATPAYDPKGWGPCGVSAVFPVRLRGPQEPAHFEPTMIEHPFGFDHSGCEMEPHAWVMLVVYLTVIFMISGAFATRVGQTLAPTRGALAAALVAVIAILHVATIGKGIDVWSTTLFGLALFAGAVCCAFLGGHLAKRNA